MIISSIILPISSLVILYWQLIQFEGIGLLPSLTMLIEGIGTIAFGLKSLGNINTVRTEEEFS